MKPFKDIGDIPQKKHFYDDRGHEYIAQKAGKYIELYCKLAGEYVSLGCIQGKGFGSLRKLHEWVTS